TAAGVEGGDPARLAGRGAVDRLALLAGRQPPATSADRWPGGRLRPGRADLFRPSRQRAAVAGNADAARPRAARPPPDRGALSLWASLSTARTIRPDLCRHADRRAGRPGRPLRHGRTLAGTDRAVAGLGRQPAVGLARLHLPRPERPAGEFLPDD